MASASVSNKSISQLANLHARPYLTNKLHPCKSVSIEFLEEREKYSSCPCVVSIRGGLDIRSIHRAECLDLFVDKSVGSFFLASKVDACFLFQRFDTIVFRAAREYAASRVEYSIIRGASARRIASCATLED